MQTKCLVTILMVVLVVESSADDSCQLEHMVLKQMREECILGPCRRTLFPDPPRLPKPVLVATQQQQQPRYDPLQPEDTLTHEVSEFVSQLDPFVNVMDGVKLVAKFFHTSETNVDTQNYWHELAATTTAFTHQTISSTILNETNIAVESLSGDLQVYLDASNTTGSVSALELTRTMDTTLVNILSLYAEMAKLEEGLLHYLDMATTRLALWQTTIFRYIADYTVHGQLETGEMVCDLVRELDSVYQEEAAFIQDDLQLYALGNWTSKYMNQLSIRCDMDCNDPFFGAWDKTIDCRVKDGYHNGGTLSSTTTECHKRSQCTHCDFVCFDYCPPSLMTPYISENLDSYRTLHSHTSFTLANFLAVQINSIDEYKEDCHIE